MSKLREFGSISGRSIMHRQAATSGQGRRLKGRSGANIVRFLWILGYLSVGLGALFSTFFYPDLLSILRSQRDSIQPYVLSQVFSPNTYSYLQSFGIDLTFSSLEVLCVPFSLGSSPNLKLVTLQLETVFNRCKDNVEEVVKSDCIVSH